MPQYKREQWVLASRIKGYPTEENFKVVEDDVPELRKGEILCRALYISIDPITRLHLTYSDQGQPVPARQIARIVESRNSDYQKGKLVMGSMGWTTYSVVDPDLTQELGGANVHLVENLPRQLENTTMTKSTALGLFGIPGLTAYIGLMEVGKPKAGETIVISSGAGQMGHIVGQIAKIMGLRVLGYTGDGEKASWIKTDLNYDWAFNYKTQDLNQTLNIAAPNGVDIFWDSVGGDFSATVLPHMSIFGRVIMVGNLSKYNNIHSNATIPALDLSITLKELTIVGFNVYRYYHLWENARERLSQWTKEGKLQAHETVTDGFESVPKAFVDMLEGVSQGKVIVRT